VPVDPAPLIDRHQCSRQTALGRPLPHHLLSILRLRPDMGEAEKVERRCLAVWMRATLALGAEVDEARLVRMEREPVPIKPLSHFQNPFGVVVALERHHQTAPMYMVPSCGASPRPRTTRPAHDAGRRSRALVKRRRLAGFLWSPSAGARFPALLL